MAKKQSPINHTETQESSGKDLNFAMAMRGTNDKAIQVAVNDSDSSTWREAGELLAEYWFGGDMRNTHIWRVSTLLHVSPESDASTALQCLIRMTGEHAAAFAEGRDHVQTPPDVSELLAQIYDDLNERERLLDLISSRAQFVVEECPMVMSEVRKRLGSGLSGKRLPQVQLVEEAMRAAERAYARAAVAGALYRMKSGIDVCRIEIGGAFDRHETDPVATSSSFARDLDPLDTMIGKRWAVLQEMESMETESDHLATLGRLEEEAACAPLSNEYIATTCFDVHTAIERYLEPENDADRKRARDLARKSLASVMVSLQVVSERIDHFPQMEGGKVHDIADFVAWFDSAEEAVAEIHQIERESAAFVREESEAIQFMTEWLLHSEVLEGCELQGLKNFVCDNRNSMVFNN